MDCDDLQALAVATIAVVLLLQWLLSLLDAYTKKRRHLQQLANTAYRETALLGLTAFILFVVEVAVNVSDTVIHQLEIMHICVWVIAVLYILWVVILVIFSIRIRKRWAHWEDVYLHSSEAYLKVKERLAAEYTEMKHITDSASAISGSTSFSFMIAVIQHPFKAFAYFKTLHIVRYIELVRGAICRSCFRVSVNNSFCVAADTVRQKIWTWRRFSLLAVPERVQTARVFEAGRASCAALGFGDLRGFS
jgi:hypothetical protein